MEAIELVKIICGDIGVMVESGSLENSSGTTGYDILVIVLGRPVYIPSLYMYWMQ